MTENIWESWVLEYQQSRYLRKLPPEALSQRYRDLLQNLWSTDLNGKPQPPRNATNRQGILRLLTHLHLEQIERQERPDGDLFDEEALRDEATKAYSAPVLKSPIVGGPSGFAKFGKRDHIRAAYDRGALRIAPAGIYNDPSLNTAQADKELEHFTVTPNEQLRFRLGGVDTDGKAVEIKAEPLQLFRYMNVPDFYVWCCGYGCDLRMFADFQAEALLFVRNQDAFRQRLLAAVANKLPESKSTHGPVTYYDPWTVRRDQLKPIFFKNLKFLYQNEYRFAWQMPPATTLSPFIVELGPLTDIAEFYELA